MTDETWCWVLFVYALICGWVLGMISSLSIFT